jgi:hypothetical protein
MGISLWKGRGIFGEVKNLIKRGVPKNLNIYAMIAWFDLSS